MAAKLAMEGKPGDAYDGKFVIRSHTQFNRNGENAPGGIQVFMAPDPNQPEAVVELGFEQRDQIYRGCYGRVGISIGDYVHSSGKNALTLYLVAFCKTHEGERIVGTSDHSTLFSAARENVAVVVTAGVIAGVQEAMPGVVPPAATPMPVGMPGAVPFVAPPVATPEPVNPAAPGMPPAAPGMPGGVVVSPTPGMPANTMPGVVPPADPGMPVDPRQVRVG